MRGGVRAWGLGAALLLAAGDVAAQDALRTAPSPVLVLDRERFYTDSRFGRGVQTALEAEARAFAEENRRIEEALEAEERDLTARRASLPPEEFRALARAFDEKVRAIRAARDSKSRDLTRRWDEARQRFLEQAVPILAELAAARGAAVILDRAQVILSFDLIDVTEAAIAAVDAVLPAPPEAPAPPPAATAD